MAGQDSCFRVNAPQVIHETIDGEVVIVNLGTGAYYSTSGVGAEIWERLAAGRPVELVVSELCASYDDAPESISASIATLVDELCNEGLIVGSTNSRQEVIEGVAVPPPPGQRRSFTAPVLEKHTDVQDLLVLDPIHDVDDSGWPRARPEGGGEH